MMFWFKKLLPVSVGLWIILLAAVDCQSDLAPRPEPDDATVAQSRQPQPSRSSSAVTGTVTYRERIALSAGAVLEVELRDVSRQDVSSTLIARQVISNPGQVPISFSIEYDPGAIEPANTYAIQARINHRDGSLAFINDTAYEVLTRGRPNNVDMVLVAVTPPPDALPTASLDSTDWVEIPAPIRVVKVEKYESGYMLTVTNYLAGDADCSRHSSVLTELVDFNIKVTVNSLENRGKDGAPACASEPREGKVEIPIEGRFTPGETYRVRVNDRVTNSFTPPREGFPDSYIATSPIVESELLILEIFPPRYNVRVVSALPKGSSCSQFNGYGIERSAAGRIEVLVAHHEVTDPNLPCTEDYPTVETTIPLGSDFEPGQEYNVYLNDDVLTFQAQ